jgi:hypothetical protein
MLVFSKQNKKVKKSFFKNRENKRYFSFTFTLHFFAHQKFCMGVYLGAESIDKKIYKKIKLKTESKRFSGL